MKFSLKKFRFLTFILILGLSSCVVSKKKYEALQKSKRRSDKKVAQLSKDNKNKDKKIKNLSGDLAKTRSEYNEMKNQLSASNAMKNSEIDNLNTEILNLSSDTSKLNRELRKAIGKYNQENEKIGILKKELERKEKRLAELENMIDKNKAKVAKLKNIISNALASFDKEDLTVVQRNGKVYVSLDEKLLFKSGSAYVGSKGKNAIKKLAKVLEKHPEIDITIEGHTDNVGKPQPNWELSTKRATAIIQIIQTSSKIDPKRLTGSGRGMYQPLMKNDTKANKAKNRRTEIILTPKLDELYKILDEDLEK